MAGKQSEQEQKQHSAEIIPLAGRAGAQQLAENQAQIEPRHMDQLPLENIVVLAQMRSPHSTCLVAMGEAAFDQLSPPSQQALAIVALDPPPVVVYRLLLTGLAFPFALPLLSSLRKVAAHLVLRYPLQQCAG